MEGFYDNDYNDKSKWPKGYVHQYVQAFEMKLELSRLINLKLKLKTGFIGKSGTINRKYIIFYKK